MFRANARRTGHYEVTGLPARGRTRWKFAYPSGMGSPSTPLVLSDRIIAADRGGVVTALEPKKGATLWTANLGGETYSSPCAADGLVFIATCAKTLTALDAQTGAQIVEMIFELNAREGTTLILVTHDEAIAARCQRRLRIHAGRLQEA